MRNRISISERHERDTNFIRFIFWNKNLFLKRNRILKSERHDKNTNFSDLFFEIKLKFVFKAEFWYIGRTRKGYELFSLHGTEKYKWRSHMTRKLNKNWIFVLPFLTDNVSLQDIDWSLANLLQGTISLLKFAKTVLKINSRKRRTLIAVSSNKWYLRFRVVEFILFVHIHVVRI